LKDKDEISFSLEHFRVSCSSSDISHATILLSSSKKFYPSDALGDGPVDSLIKAIKKIINKNIVLSDYKITSKGVGSQAIGQADIWVDFDKKTFHGRNKSNDIIEASARAYLNAVNCVLSYEKVRMKKIENEVSSRECYI
jgi:2-isopropylmalate synthase